MIRSAALLVLALAASCTRHEVLTVEAAPPGPGIDYVWAEGDTWRFLAWALLDSEDGRGHETLALASGRPPGVEPLPGDLVRLPLDPALAGALQSRLAAARLVREATSAPSAAESLLLEAVEADGAWSVPRYDLALLMMADGREGEARGILAPVAGKPRAEMLLAFLDWAGEDLRSAIGHLESAAAGDPPPEALAAAATAYMAAGQDYLASRMWLRLLQDPGAPSDLRLEAVRYCLMLSGRLELQEPSR